MNSQPDRVCAKCGKAIAQSRPHATRYCDADCRRAAERDRRGVGQQVVMRPCERCGVTFDANPPTGGPPMRYCTANCRVLADRKRRSRRKAELRKQQASTPERTCPDCGAPLPLAQMRRCASCAEEWARELRRKRERERRKAKRLAPRVITSKPVDSYDVRKYDRRRKTTRADIDSWITATGGGRLPADPLEALKVVLAEHEDFREAFADVHGI